jgi:uncharacterized protein YndB with AHSA1/START domain
MSQQTRLEPVVVTIDLSCSVEHAFDTYTDNMAAWWPLDSHAVETDKATFCVFEAHEGGSIYEVTSEGKQQLWGTVLDCTRPHLLRHTWHPGGDPQKPTTVALQFATVGTGSRLTLTHEGFEILGERGPAVREGYGPGWQFVAGERFKSCAEA